MKWTKVEPQQGNWKEQYDLRAYYGEYTVGSVVLDDQEDWCTVVDVVNGAVEPINCSNLSEAKEELYTRLEQHYEDQIRFYQELSEMLEELKESENTKEEETEYE